MLQLRRSLIITFCSTNLSSLVGFGVVLILSRLLTPSEVGVFSITAVFIGITAVFREFGVSSYLQQEKNLTSEKICSAMGLLVTTSWILAAFIYGVSDCVAIYYGQEGIGRVMRVLSISFALVPFSSIFYALLWRDLQAGKQAVVNAISTLAYAVTCITLAYNDFSYMALAWANVVNIAVTILVYIPLRPKGIQLIPSFSGWRAPIQFGIGSIAGNLATQIHSSVPDLVLGKVNSAHAVGLYSRANGLVGIVLQLFGPTVYYSALPYIAKSHHANQELGSLLSKSTSYLTALGWPPFIAIAMFTEEIIRVLYGDKWVEAAPLVVLLCVSSGARIGYTLCQASLTAIGRTDLLLITPGIGLATRAALIYLVNAADLVTFALALCIADLITVAVPAVLMSRYLGYSIRQSVCAHVDSFKVSVSCFVILVLLDAVMPSHWPDVVRLILAAGWLSVTWIVGIVYFKHPLSKELSVLLAHLHTGRKR